MRALAVAVLGLTLTGCNGVFPTEDVLGFRDLGRDLRRFYERDAWEASATCLMPNMDVILGAEVVEQGPEFTTIRVRYGWRSGSGASAIGCRGTSERDFVIRPAGDTATVVSMTGGQRPPRR